MWRRVEESKVCHDMMPEKVLNKSKIMVVSIEGYYM